MQDDYTKKHLGLKQFPPGLFAHNIMQKNAKTVEAANDVAKGVLGRIVAELAKDTESGAKAMKSAMYSLLGYQRMLDGASAPHIISERDGVLRFLDYAGLAGDIANLSKLESESLFADAYSASDAHLVFLSCRTTLCFLVRRAVPPCCTTQRA